MVVKSHHQKFIDVTGMISDYTQRALISVGLCHIFIKHTSASVIITENADPNVHRDLQTFMERIAPEDDYLYLHDSEGRDDMPAHIRTVLTQSSLFVPVSGGRLNLGRWQGIYLWEHRAVATERQLVVTVSGLDTISGVEV
ncbi:MAG: secondary thiamine-phosphate synthase [Acidiferrobacteraceae bacterium]|nr:secondary thiamine-phosphate synthase [Acidiferrobacteraceae bacterium]